MNFDLVQIFRDMGLIDQALAAVLGLFTIAAVAVFLERLWVLWRGSRASRQFAGQAAPLVDRGAYTDLQKLAASDSAGPLGRLVSSGVAAYLKALGKPGDVSPSELAKRELEREAEALDAELRRGLGLLASIGSVAPFVGLLGTVFGIIHAFSSISAAGSSGLGVVSGSIAQALVVTAFGLVVAIPAVLMFNLLSARVDAVMLGLHRARGELGDHLESRPSRAVPVLVGASDASAA